MRVGDNSRWDADSYDRVREVADDDCSRTDYGTGSNAYAMNDGCADSNPRHRTDS
jgi:hypothetical protein